MKNLYDILACPVCKTAVARIADQIVCSSCGRRYPVVNGVPVLLPDGTVPDIRHEQDLTPQGTYYPWIHRVVLQSLLDDQIVVEIGSGEVAIDDPNIIRLDVRLTPHVDLVADAHALPFLPGSVDFIFSLAVVEHLRQPFEAAKEWFGALKDGGYIYHECNFVFAYHAYPNHFFNASMQGMEQIFAPFRVLRKGVAPYQMPSMALQMVLLTYLRHSSVGQHRDADGFRAMLETVVEQELVDFDRYFTEEQAAYVAAGTYLFGMKQRSSGSSVIPTVIRDIWEESPHLQERFPHPEDIGAIDNVLHWAATEGRIQFPAINRYLTELPVFHKRGCQNHDRSVIRSFPFIKPKFGTLWDFPTHAPARKVLPGVQQRKALLTRLREKLGSLLGS